MLFYPYQRQGGAGMDIRRIESGKRDFLPLLLLGDEQEDMIDRYLDRGTLLALYDGGLRAVCVVTKEAPACSRSKIWPWSRPFSARLRRAMGSACGRRLPDRRRDMLLVAPGTVPSPSPSTGPAVPGKPPGPQFLPSILRPPHIRRGAAFVGHGIFVHGALSGKGGAAENQRRRLYHTV